MRRISPALLVALVALVGCGSSSTSSSSTSTTTSTTATSTEASLATFKSEFQAQKITLTALGKAVGAAVEGASHHTDEALAKQFRSLASRATTLAGSLGQLNAPTAYKAELSTLQSSVTQVAGTLHSIEAAAAAHDATAAKAGGESIVADAEQVKSADNKLSAKLGLPTSH
jgi:hypothetical protein